MKKSNLKTVQILFFLFILTAVMVFSTSCGKNQLKLGKQYFFYYTDSESDVLKKSESYLKFDRKRFVEDTNIDNYKNKYYGNYNFDKEQNQIHISYDNSQILQTKSKIDKAIEKNPKHKQYLEVLKNNIVVSNVTLHSFKNYIVHPDYISAFKMPREGYSLTSLDGYYQVPSGNKDGKTNIFLLNQGVVYIADKEGNVDLSKKSGEYKIEGDYLLLKTINTDGLLDVKPQKYLIAQLNLSTQLDGEFSTVYTNNLKIDKKVETKMTVLVKAFYRS